MLLRAARALAARGQYGAARTLFDWALRFSPQDAALLRERLALATKSGDAAQITADCRRLLARMPNDVPALETLAVFELAAGRVEAARSVLEDAHRRGLLADFQLKHDAVMDPARAQADGVYVSTLRDVTVDTGYWAVFDGERVYSAETQNRNLRNSPLVGNRASPDDSAFLFRLPPLAQTIEQPCVLLGGDDNYCHWVTRNLFKLALIEGTPDDSLPLLVNADLRRHQREFLELLGIAESRLLPVARPSLVRLREAVVPTNFHNHLKMGRAMQWLRGRLARWIDPAPPRERLYVSRRDARVRKLVNEDEVEAALAPLGFRTIVPGEMPVREQIAAFSRASVIVGAHGAAFGNLVFAPPGAQVVEINSAFKSHIRDFPFLAKLAGIGFTSVVSDDYDFSRSEPYQADTDFRVDVDEVMAALRRLAPALFGK